MRFLIFILAVLVVAFIVWRIGRGGKIEIVAHAKLLFKTWSVWLASVGSVIGAWVQSFPDSATYAWNGLPEDVKSFIPQHFLGLGAAFMVAMAVIAQFIRQKKLVKELPRVVTTASGAEPAAVLTAVPAAGPVAVAAPPPAAAPVAAAAPPPAAEPVAVAPPPPAAEPVAVAPPPPETNTPAPPTTSAEAPPPTTPPPTTGDKS